MTNYLTVTETSDILGIHPHTLRRWAEHGLIGYIRLPNGHRRFTVAEVERVLTEGAVDRAEKRGRIRDERAAS